MEMGCSPRNSRIVAEPPPLSKEAPNLRAEVGEVSPVQWKQPTEWRLPQFDVTRLPTMILHLIPKNALASAHFGSYKDIISRVNWFRSQDVEYLQFPIGDDAGELDGLPAADAVHG